MTTNDDGSPASPSGDSLDDTPEMKRLIETLRTSPAAREKLLRIIERALSEEHTTTSYPEDMAPDEADEDKGR